MTHSSLRATSTFACAWALAACSGSPAPATAPAASAPDATAYAPTSDAAAPAPFDAAAYALEDGESPQIGAPCISSRESDPGFDGFDRQEVGFERGAEGLVCLIYYFQGRVTCPYGQDAMPQDAGQDAAPAARCETSSGEPVVGQVEPQCVDRRAAKTVFWSCRCADFGGGTGAGFDYCACPPGTACVPTILPTGAEDDDVSGSYCVPPGAVIDLDAGPVCAVTCDPTSSPCP